MLAVHAAGHDAECDVGGIEPVMRDGCDWIRHGRYAVWKRDGPQSRFPDGAAIDLPSGHAAQRRVVRGGYLHEQIVLMLPVVDLLAATLLARCEQVRIPAAGHGPRLQTEHAAKLQMAVRHAAIGHAHHPVDAAGLIGSARTRRMHVLHERVFMPHHHPRTPLGVEQVHG